MNIGGPSSGMERCKDCEEEFFNQRSGSWDCKPESCTRCVRARVMAEFYMKQQRGHALGEPIMTVHNHPTLNVYGDIAGQFETFKALYEAMPAAHLQLCVGDLIDRGPDSAKVIQFCIDNSIGSLLGNHEAFMLDFYHHGFSRKAKYLSAKHGHAWLPNGGLQTIWSYGVAPFKSNYTSFYALEQIHLEFVAKVPKEHIEFLERMPLYYLNENGVLVTHAPVTANCAKWQVALVDDEQYEFGNYALWARQAPRDRQDEGVNLQVFGHNGHLMGLTYFGDQNLPFALCIDDCQTKKLTGVHIRGVQCEVWQENYIQ